MNLRVHQEVRYLSEMTRSNDNDPGKRDADAAKDDISEVKAKIQGAGEADSNDSSDGNVGSVFSSLPCTEICEIPLEV